MKFINKIIDQIDVEWVQTILLLYFIPFFLLSGIIKDRFYVYFPLVTIVVTTFYWLTRRTSKGSIETLIYWINHLLIMLLLMYLRYWFFDGKNGFLNVIYLGFSSFFT